MTAATRGAAISDQPVSDQPVSDQPVGAASIGAAAVDDSPAQALARRAGAAGLVVHACAAWPESALDGVPPAVAGFIVSSFSPLVAEVAERCLRRRFEAPPANPQRDARVAIVLVSSVGDVASAIEVARAVDAGRRIGPLLFFQAVPNAVAGHVAARWGLTGPVVCLGSTGDGLDVAALLIEDGDADEALVIVADQACHADQRDCAVAVLVGPHADLSQTEGAPR